VASCADPSGLFAAAAGGNFVGACWVQPQPGNTAVCWPPQLMRPCTDAVDMLLDAATKHLDQHAVKLTQALASNRSDRVIALLTNHGFFVLADLAYLSWERQDVPPADDESVGVEFEPFDTTKRDRLCKIVEQTYEATLDCPRLNHLRSMDEVLDGYQATGEFDPANWFIVRQKKTDVGALLLNSHSAIGHCELVYMGMVPTARGRGLGRRIVRHAQRVLAQRNLQRLVLAVDTSNRPAATIYRRAGFQPWDQRTVLVRPLQKSCACKCTTAA
jgi:ribosomal protein S18 acetylase RimI-like enzyme